MTFSLWNPVGILGMNSNGAVVGYSAYAGGAYGFLLHSNGTSFNAYTASEGGYVQWISVSVAGGWDTSAVPEAINDDGVIAGWYGIVPGHNTPTFTGGFVRSPQGDYTVFNPPGTLVQPDEFPVTGPPPPSIGFQTLSLNGTGFISGSYTDSTGILHGFVRNPYGTITPFDPPRGMQTTVTGINDAGVIVGSFYYDWNSQTAIGFLRIPV